MDEVQHNAVHNAVQTMLLLLYNTGQLKLISVRSKHDRFVSTIYRKVKMHHI